jgi:hypothetical protein
MGIALQEFGTQPHRVHDFRQLLTSFRLRQAPQVDQRRLEDLANGLARVQ